MTFKHVFERTTHTALLMISLSVLTVPEQAFSEVEDSFWDNISITAITSQGYISDIEIVEDRVFFATYGGGIFWTSRESGEVLGKLDSASGLGHNLACTLHYDSASGRLWVGTFNGIARLDTVSMRLHFEVAPARYRQTDVTAITSAGERTHFCCYEGLRIYSPPPPSPKVDEVGWQSVQQREPRELWSFLLRPQGLLLNDLYSALVWQDKVWFGGVGSIFCRRVGEEAWRKYDLPEDLCLAQVLDIIPERGGEDTLLLATSEGLYRLNTTTGVVSGAEEFSADAGKVRALAYVGDELYAVTDKGLYLLEKGDEYALLGSNEGLPMGTITSLEADGDKLWVGGEDGAYIYYPAGDIAVPIENPFDLLPHPAVFSLVGGEERLWIGTGDGLAAFSPQDGPLRVDVFPPGTPIFSLALDDDTLYCGTKRGLFACSTAQPLATPKPIPLMEPEPQINDLLVVDGTLLAATERGLFIMDGEETRRLTIPDGLGNNRVFALAQLGGLVYAGTFGGGVAVVDPRNWRIVDRLSREEDGLASDFIFSLEPTSRSLFVGTWEGGLDIYKPEEGVVGNITWGDGLSHTDIWAIYALSPWVVLSVRSVGINVYDFDKGEVVCYLYARRGLGDGYIRDIEYFGDSFWFAGSGGLCRVSAGGEVVGWSPPPVEAGYGSTAEHRNW